MSYLLHRSQELEMFNLIILMKTEGYFFLRAGVDPEKGHVSKMGREVKDPGREKGTQGSVKGWKEVCLLPKAARSSSLFCRITHFNK